MFLRILLILIVHALFTLSGTAFAQDSGGDSTSSVGKEDDPNQDVRAKNYRKKKCVAAKKDLAKLVAKETELKELEREKRKKRDELKWKIATAEEWTGSVDLYRPYLSGPDSEGRKFWYCPVCRGPEKSAANRFSRYALVEGNNPMHAEPLPYYVEDYRWIFELEYKARIREVTAVIIFGKEFRLIDYAPYGNWQLRDYYLVEAGKKLEHITKDTNRAMDNYIAAKKLVQKKRKETKKFCSRTAAFEPKSKSTSTTPGEKPTIECDGDGIVRNVNCVEKRMKGQ